jgi:hypothetical protein
LHGTLKQSYGTHVADPVSKIKNGFLRFLKSEARISELEWHIIRQMKEERLGKSVDKFDRGIFSLVILKLTTPGFSKA